MSVTQTCRDINELRNNAKQACMLLFQECYKAGIRDIFITETYRSQQRQNYLYQQGRTRPGNVVTWTTSSNHTPRLAWDIAVAPPKSLYDKETLNKVGAIAGKLGIEWGGTWKAPNYDAPHFQVSTKWTIPTGYKLEDVFVPTSSSERISIKQSKPSNEEDDLLKFTSDTTKAAVRDHIKQMVDNKYIGSEWLSKFDNGTLTSGDYEGLSLIGQQRKAAKK